MRMNARSKTGAKPLHLTLHALGRTAIVELEPVRTEPAGDFSSATDRLQTEAFAVFGADGGQCRRMLRRRRNFSAHATQFDRAMVYRFLPDDSGEVVAEDAREDLESFLGLHYPASDIPQQARELYRRNWIRTIPDITMWRRR